MKINRDLVSIGVAAAIALYYVFVILPWESSLSGQGPQGLAGAQALKAKLADLRKTVPEVEARLASKEVELRRSIGTLRLSEPSSRGIEAMIVSMQRACIETGAQLVSATPIPSRRNPLLELRGVAAHFVLSSESVYPDLLTRVRGEHNRRHREAVPMVHGLTLSKAKNGLDVVAEFSIVQKTQKLESYHAIEEAREDYTFEGLFEPKDPPKVEYVETKAVELPVPVSNLATPTSEVEATTEVAAPPTYPGRLVGVASAGGVDIAILDLGGVQDLVAEGESSVGFRVVSVRPTEVEMKQGETTVTLSLLPPEETGEVAATNGARSAGSRPKGAPSLGLSGGFEPVRSQPPPDPYHKMQRVFVLRALEDGGPAARAGLRIGDRVLSLEGKPLRLGSQLLGARTRLQAGKTIALEVERNLSILSVELNP